MTTDISAPTQTPHIGLGQRVRTRLMRYWVAVLAWFRGPEPPPPQPVQPPGRLSQRHDLPDPIVVPARGHVFEFQVFASLNWSSDGLTHDELNARARSFVRLARRELSQLGGDVARNYPPYQARELEIELNRRISDRGVWRFERGDEVLTCHPHVRVGLDERVKQHLQPYWERRIRMECEHDVQVRRAQLADQLTQRWMVVLGKLRDNPLADGAAKLAEQELAEVVAELQADRREADDRLKDLLDNVIQMGADLDSYERAAAFDVIIDELRRRTGHHGGVQDGNRPNGKSTSGAHHR